MVKAAVATSAEQKKDGNKCKEAGPKRQSDASRDGSENPVASQDTKPLASHDGSENPVASQDKPLENGTSSNQKPGPKAAAKDNKAKEKKGKNKIQPSAESNKKLDNDKPKAPRKETALTMGWKDFCADYMKNNKNTGKKLGQLMKEASEQWCSQLLRSPTPK